MPPAWSAQSQTCGQQAARAVRRRRRASRRAASPKSLQAFPSSRARADRPSPGLRFAPATLSPAGRGGRCLLPGCAVADSCGQQAARAVRGSASLTAELTPSHFKPFHRPGLAPIAPHPASASLRPPSPRRGEEGGASCQGAQSRTPAASRPPERSGAAPSLTAQRSPKPLQAFPPSRLAPSPLTRPPLRSGHPLPGGERRAVPPAWGARSRTPAAGGERRAVPPARVRSRGLLRPAGRPSAPWRRRASRRSAPPRPPSSVKPSLGSCSKGPFKPSHRNASPLHARSREATLPSGKGDRHGVELAVEDTTRLGGGAAAEKRSAAGLPGLCRCMARRNGRGATSRRWPARATC